MDDKKVSADHEARSYVNGMRRAKVPAGHPLDGRWVIASGCWSVRFREHPWAIQSDAEGWGAALRGHLIMIVKRKILEGAPYGDIDALMPDKAWVEHERQWAARARMASEWRGRMADAYGSFDDYLTATRSRRRPRGAVSAGHVAASVVAGLNRGAS